MKLRPTRLALVVAAVAVTAGGLAAVLRPTPVTVAEVVARDLSPAVHGVGTVEAKVVVQFGAKIGGRLAAVLVDQGDAVRRGQVLARLDDAQLVAEVRRGAAAVETMTSQLRDVEAGARQEEIAEARANVDRARAQLDDVLAGSRRQEIEEVRERLRAATATRVVAERDLRRSETLFGRELIAAQEVDRARQAFDVAAAQERAARETLDLALEGPRTHLVASTRAQLAAAEHRLAVLQAGPRPNQVAAHRAQLREAEAALALARERHADGIVTSSLDGFVVSRELEPGATVNPGTPIVKLADPASAWVTVHVDERETALVAPGDPAEVTLRSQPGAPLRGRVTRVRRESDRVTEQLAVDITLDARPARLTLGEQADAVIRPAARRGVTAVPAAALVRTRDGLGVFTVVDGRLRFRAIRPGATDGAGWVEVAGDVRPGDRVVVAPGRLADGASEGRRVLARLGKEQAAPAASAR